MSLAVIDASVVVTWLVANQPYEAEAEAVRERFEWLAPALIVSEVANALGKRVRVGELRLEEAIEAIAAARTAIALREDWLLVEVAQRLSAANNHPIYDCMYASLAIRESAPLVTADERSVRKLRGAPGLHFIPLSEVSI